MSFWTAVDIDPVSFAATVRVYGRCQCFKCRVAQLFPVVRKVLGQ